MEIVTMIAIILITPVLPMSITSLILWAEYDKNKLGKTLFFTAIAFFFIALTLFLLPCLEAWPC